MFCAMLAPWAIAVICIAVVFFAVAAYALGCYLGFYFIIVKPPVVSADRPNPLMGEDFAAFVKKTQEDAVIMKKLRSEPVEVVTRDGLTLRGEFYRAAEPSDITIVCLHGYNSNAYGDYATRGLSYLHSGYNVLLANHRHHGKSDGKYIGFGVLDRHDVLKWSEAAAKLVPGGKIFISGVSMGGATAMQCAYDGQRGSRVSCEKDVRIRSQTDDKIYRILYAQNSRLRHERSRFARSGETFKSTYAFHTRNGRRIRTDVYGQGMLRSLYGAQRTRPDRRRGTRAIVFQRRR